MKIKNGIKKYLNKKFSMNKLEKMIRKLMKWKLVKLLKKKNWRNRKFVYFTLMKLTKQPMS